MSTISHDLPPCTRVAALLGWAALLLASGCTTTQEPARAQATSIAMRADAPSADLASILQTLPAASPGQIRWVITLPARADADHIRVELLPTLRKQTDCNQHMASATVQGHTVDGWGYRYMVMGEIGPVVSTMMGCPAGTSQVRDVRIHTNLTWQRYNSHAPIVFYAPEQVTLRYRLWHGQDTVQVAVPSADVPKTQ